MMSCGIHDGTFHADEVTAVALLVEAGLVDISKVIRTRDERLLSKCDFVCDVGGVYDPEKKRFDHHQADYKEGLSSAGMILKYLKNQKIFSHEYAEYLDRNLVHGVDLIDNGAYTAPVGICTFSNVISSFIPTSYEATKEELDKAFFEAVGFVRKFLLRTKERFIYISSCKQQVAKVMQENSRCLIFDEPIPWLESFFEMGGENHTAEFVIMPSGNHWKLRGIPPSYEERMKVRVPLPIDWAGLTNHDLANVSGIKGSIFCHKERFISIWETKEDAIKALELICGNYI
ncbi:MAG: MYG1 family protein [Chlamydiae bacterium]|nr:MYG1 family protein [Chlamydiota bacterium]